MYQQQPAGACALGEPPQFQQCYPSSTTSNHPDGSSTPRGEAPRFFCACGLPPKQLSRVKLQSKN
jgi:hypothetical protein